MFVLNEDNSIYVTRGDVVFFSVTADDEITKEKYIFQAGDVVRIKIYGRKEAENVVLQKDFPVYETGEYVEIFLSEEDTKIGEVISKPKDYWYEVELNPFTNPQTIIGHDEDGAKVFKLFPEGADIPEYEPTPEDIPFMDNELDMTSTRPVENQAIARAVTRLKGELEKINETFDKKTESLTNAFSGAENEIAVERARIDNLVSGATPEGSEVVDIRVGADGNAYPSAGVAVRNQLSVLRDQFNNSLTETDNAFNPIDCKNNTSFSTTAGSESENTSYWVTGLIPANGCDKLAANVLMYKCGCYDTNLNYIGVALDANDTVYKQLLDGTAYVKIQFSQVNVPFYNRFAVMVVPCVSSEPVPILVHKPHMASGYKDILDNSVSVSKLHSNYEKAISTELLKTGVLPFVVEDFVIGGIDPSKGSFVVDGLQRIVLKKPFYIPKGTSINFGANFARILYYDENGVYTGVYDNNLTSKYFDTECHVILAIAASDNGVITENRKHEIYNSLNVSVVSDSVEVLPIGQYVFSFGLNGVTYMSDHTMIKGKLYVINASSDDHSAYAGVTVYSVDPNTKTVAYEKTIQHNLGHANSIDYCEGNDCLILGNGSSDATLPGKIFILPNVSERDIWEFSDCIVIDVASENWGIKTNVVWGEHNGEQFNVAYVITNNNANVRKILLGYNGKGFDGSYIVLGEWSAASGLDVNQGTVFRNGKLYEAIGHSQLWVTENTLNDNGTITQIQRKDVFVDKNGSVLVNPFSEGITIENGFAYVGGSNGRIYVYKV